MLILDIAYYGDPIPTTTLPDDEISPSADTSFFVLNAEILWSKEIKYSFLEFEVYAYKAGTVSLQSINAPGCGNNIGICAQIYESGIGSFNKASRGSHSVVKGYNKIKLIEKRDFRWHNLFYVTGPVAVLTTTESLYSDIHKCLSCSGCGGWTCTFPIYCGSCNKPLSLRRALIRFAIQHTNDAVTDSDYLTSANMRTYFYRNVYQFKANYPVVGSYKISYGSATTKITVIDDYLETIQIKCQSTDVYINQKVKCYGRVGSRRPGGIKLKVDMGDSTTYSLSPVNMFKYGSDSIPSSIKYNNLETGTFVSANSEILFSYGILKKISLFATAEGNLTLNGGIYDTDCGFNNSVVCAQYIQSNIKTPTVTIVDTQITAGYNDITIDSSLFNVNILHVELNSNAMIAIEPDLVSLYSDLKVNRDTIHCKHCQGPNKQRSAYFQIEVDYSSISDSYHFSFEHSYTSVGSFTLKAELIENSSIGLDKPIDIKVSNVEEEVEISCQKSMIKTGQEVICYAELMTDNTLTSNLTVETDDSAADLVLKPLDLVYYGFEIPNQLGSYYYTSEGSDNSTDFAAFNSEIMIKYGVIQVIEVYSHLPNDTLNISFYSFFPDSAESITNKNDSKQHLHELTFNLSSTPGYNQINISDLNIHLEYANIVRVKTASIVLDLTRTTVFNDENWNCNAGDACITRLYCPLSHCDGPLYKNNRRRAFIRFGVSYKHNPRSAQFSFIKSYDTANTYTIKAYSATSKKAKYNIKVFDSQKIQLYCQSLQPYYEQDLKCYALVSSVIPLSKINVDYGDGTPVDTITNKTKLSYGHEQIPLSLNANDVVKPVNSQPLAVSLNGEILIQQGILTSIEIYASSAGTIEIYGEDYRGACNLNNGDNCATYSDQVKTYSVNANRILLKTKSVTAGYNLITFTATPTLMGLVNQLYLTASLLTIERDYVSLWSDYNLCSGCGNYIYTINKKRRIYFKATVDYSAVSDLYYFSFVKKYSTSGSYNMKVSLISDPSVDYSRTINVGGDLKVLCQKYEYLIYQEFSCYASLYTKDATTKIKIDWGDNTPSEIIEPSVDITYGNTVPTGVENYGYEFGTYALYFDLFQIDKTPPSMQASKKIVLLNNEILLKNGRLRTVEFYSMQDGNFDLYVKMFDNSLCGFESELPCSDYYLKNKPDNYTLKTLLTNVNMKAGYNKLDLDSNNIKLYENSLFVIIAHGGATVLESRIAPYPDVRWDSTVGLPVYCKQKEATITTCPFPYSNMNINIKFVLSYDQDNFNLVKYQFKKRYQKAGTFDMVTTLADNDNVKRTKKMKISNSLL
jgi:hypothetical protein